MNNLLKADRRKFSIIDIIAGTVFVLVILSLTLWIFKIDTSLNTVKTMQNVVLDSNQKSTKACNLVQTEMEKMRGEVTKIYWLVLKATQREQTTNGGDSSR